MQLARCPTAQTTSEPSLKHEADYATTKRKINTSPQSIDDKEYLKKLLTDPPIKKIDLHFPLGLEVTARNMKGVTIKDAMDAIHKQFKKKVSLHARTPYLNATPQLRRDGLLTLFWSIGRRRARSPLPRRFRVGSGRMLYQVYRAPEEDGGSCSACGGKEEVQR